MDNGVNINEDAKTNQSVVAVLTHSVALFNIYCNRAKCLEAILYLEFASIPYKRKVSRYNVNAFLPELDLPLLRYNLQSTRNVIEFCEGTCHPLNAHLQLSQRADVAALQSLIRDRLHLVILHQIYAIDANWTKYCNEMHYYLPFFLRKYLLNKERKSALQQLTRHQIITTQHAKELLVDCVNVLFLKMHSHGHDHDVGHIIEIDSSKQNGSGSNDGDDAPLRFFFGGATPTTLDAVLCAHLVMLECMQLPYQYIDDIKNDAKARYLLRYARRITLRYHSSILAKLDTENEVDPIPILNKPKEFLSANMKNTHKKSYFDSDEKKHSALFVVGSVALLALYWGFVQPRSN